ncbi:MAG TPA: hypothetical protein PK228_11205 [Saprospiraceae bacterium]|nr:hypothetical protein [Saprospiraceae bacterium]
MKIVRTYLPALLTGFLFPFASSGQVFQPDTNSIFGLLQQYAPLNVSIETDLKQLVNDKAEEVWQPAVFKVLTGDSVALQIDVQVAARGNMRKKNCDFPPVKIRFYKQKPLNDSIADINEIKLVTSCSNTSQNEEWVKREYLLYELYNLLTEHSFRVKPATVRFQNTGKKNNPIEGFSFFIESEDELAARLGGKPVKPRVGSTRSLDSASYDRMCLFEFMIGNTDWSVRARHNIKLIYLKQANSIIAVPYDFDYSGAVGTNYAVPNGDYPIESVQDRYYLGLCRTTTHYQQIFDFYLSKEAALMNHIEQADYLPANARRQMADYLKGFFKTLHDPRLAKRDILQNCNKGR